MAHGFEFSSSAVPDSVKVVSFRGREQLSAPYQFDIYVSVPGDVEIDLADAVGSRASLIVKDGMLPVARYGGVLASIELVRAIHGNALYVARLVPRLWQLSLTRHSRIFTKQTITQVIEEVLQEEGIIDYELRVSDSYEVEEHICQYKESSLDFLHRWMEREGLYYFFEQTDDGDKLVITDAKSFHESVSTGAVPYHPTSGADGSAGRHFDNFTARHTSTPANVKLTDFDYAKPSLELSGSADVSPNGFGSVQLYGSRFFTPSAGARLARIRAEELRAKAVTYHATGAAAGIAPGFTVTLEHHPHSSLNKDYLATGVEHFGFVTENAGAWGSLVSNKYPDIYRNELTAIDADLQYRHPEQTTWPRIDGYENGVIDGAATSEYAQIDDHGRYLVKFKFDEGTLKDGKASTYVRMAQPHAGGIEGWHFPLRKGTEVMFVFLGGDPDRPVIAGAIPNAHTPSPVTSGNHTRNVIQTGGRNRLELEDLAGMQRITMSTPHANTYLRMGSANDDHELIAKTDMRGLWKTGNNTDFDIKGHWWIEVNQDKKEHITGVVEEWFKATKLEKVPSGLVTEEYKAQKTTIAETYMFKVGTTTGEKYTGDHSVGHGANLTETVGGNFHLGVGVAAGDTGAGGPEGGAKYGVNVSGDYKLHVTSTEIRNIDAKQTVTIKGGQEVNVSGGNVDYKVPGNDFNLTCINNNVTATGKSWHETNGPKSELVLGFKHDTVVGGHSDNHVGLHQELHIGGHIDLSAAVQVEAFFGIKLEAEMSAGIHLRICEIADKKVRIQGGTALAVKQALTRITAGAVRIAQGFHIIT
ncbi:MAG: type VI secretion system tip protein VgrG [Polyangiaceae bacterium]|nr:type VI secretion system tip protein VgrG [Polyangiaceae bacterium]